MIYIKWVNIIISVFQANSPYPNSNTGLLQSLWWVFTCGRTSNKLQHCVILPPAVQQKYCSHMKLRKESRMGARFILLAIPGHNTAVLINKSWSTLYANIADGVLYARWGRRAASVMAAIWTVNSLMIWLQMSVQPVFQQEVTCCSARTPGNPPVNKHQTNADKQLFTVPEDNLSTYYLFGFVRRWALSTVRGKHWTRGWMLNCEKTPFSRSRLQLQICITRCRYYTVVLPSYR